DWASRLCDHAEAIAANSGHMRLDHAKDCGGGDRSIGCVAAAAQGLDGSKARQWMRGGGDAVGGDDRRAAWQMKGGADGSGSRGVEAAHARIFLRVMNRLQVGCLTRRHHTSFLDFRIWRPRYMPVLRSIWCGRRSSPESLSSI